MVQENSRERQKRLWNELHDASQGSRKTARNPTAGTQDVWADTYKFLTSAKTNDVEKRMTRPSDDLTNG